MPGVGARAAIELPAGLELRAIRPEEQRAYVTSLRRTFGGAIPTDEDLAASREITEFDRTLAVFDNREIVATAGIFSYEMTVPGGRLGCGGVTRVTVMPTHRRKGLLTAMMRQQLHDMHERGEPLGALYASEAPIYGRFGYGLATYQAEMEVTRSRAAFSSPPSGKGRVRMVDVPTATSAFARVWEAIRPTQPGMLGLDEHWWRSILRDPESQRQGFSAHYRVLHEVGGTPTGFALYRVKLDWDSIGPTGVLKLESLMAVDAAAYAALWHYLLGVDLMAKIVGEERRVDEPLRFLLADSRQPKLIIQDGIWLRLVDVAAALAGRRYAVDGSMVIEVHDELCPWNEGRFEIVGGPSGANCQRSTAEPDLEITVGDLGAAYLAGNHFRGLHEARRVIERRPGALARADLMFASDRVPWCPSHF